MYICLVIRQIHLIVNYGKCKINFLALCLLILLFLQCTYNVYAQEAVITKENMPAQIGISKYRSYGYLGKYGQTQKTTSTNYTLFNDSNFTLDESVIILKGFDTIFNNEINDSFNKKNSNLKLSYLENKYTRYYYNITDSVLYLQSFVSKNLSNTFRVEQWDSLGVPELFYPSMLEDTVVRRFVTNGRYMHYKDTVNFSLDFAGLYLKRYTTIEYQGRCGYISPGGQFSYDSLYIIKQTDTTLIFPAIFDGIPDIDQVEFETNTYFFSPKLKKNVYRHKKYQNYFPNPRIETRYSENKFYLDTTLTYTPEAPNPHPYQLKIIPNPTSANIYFEFYNDLPGNESIIIRLYDPWGRIIIMEPFIANPGLNTHSINISHLISNQYVLELEGNDKKEASWVVIVGQ